MKIALLGYGKMGHEVEKAAMQRGHQIVVTIDNEQEWTERFEQLKQADVAIDFSQPDQAAGNISRCFDLHLPVVVGTTAWYDHFDAISKRCADEKQSLFYAPNFSIGMNMMFKMNKLIAKFAETYNYRLSLSETHHIHKLDKPSGTAVKLANDIIAANNDYQSWSLDANGEGILPVTAIREGEVNGIHSVKAHSEVDEITLTHEAFSRQGFAVGALVAAEFLIGKTGCFTMDDLMQI